MNDKTKGKIKIIVTLICIILLSVFFSISTFITKGKCLINSLFLVNYLGIFIGISITLVIYIHTTIATFKEESSICNILKELKQDTLLVFWFFVFSILIMGIERIDNPWISLGNYLQYKLFIIDLIRNLTLFLSIYAMYDILGCLFILIFKKS